MKLFSSTGHQPLALLLAAALLAGCGGGTSQPPTPMSNGGGDDSGTPQPASKAKLAASLPGELVRYFQDKLAQRAAKGILPPSSGPVFSASPAPSAATAFAGTTVQEGGVDEDDLLKTDGSMLYSLVRSWNTGTSNLVPPSKLLAHRREAGGQLTALGELPLVGDAYYSGLYLHAESKRVAVLGQRDLVGLPIAGGGGVAFTVYPTSPAKISLEVVDVSTPAAATATHKIEIDGRLVGSRVIGNHLYLVSNWSPALLADRLPFNSKERADATQQLTSAAILPTITVNKAAAQALLPETDCYVQPANASVNLELTTITMFDLASPNLTRSSKCFVGGSEALYMSQGSAYLASTRFGYGPDGGRGIVYSAQTSTDVHKFSLTSFGIDYRGSGNITGHLGWDMERKSYRMSEYNGDLRVLTFTGETGWILPATTSVAPTFTTAPSPATLSILRENLVKRSLETVSILPNGQRPAPLGKPGEQVYGVRFAGARGYVVTFRRIDPLYVLDLSNPADPKAVGELTALGFSDYLFPLDNGLLLGVGKDAASTGMVGGVKVALLDVADPANPKELATRVYGKSGSGSALDTSRHGINLFKQGETTRVGLPVRINDAAKPGGWFAPSSQGLIRLEVNHTTRTLVDKPMLSSIFFTTDAMQQQAYSTHDVGQERSVQIGAQVYYLSGGSLRGEAW